jgi:uracil phosphoribosyltransferase
MLATGGSAAAAISLFDKLGVKQIQLVSFVAAPEGIKLVHSKFPNVRITTAAIDQGLNEHAYIVPGLGDAGDRAFGT